MPAPTPQKPASDREAELARLREKLLRLIVKNENQRRLVKSAS